jgi:hypothetical protein
MGHMKDDFLLGNFVQDYTPIGQSIEWLLAQLLTPWNVESPSPSLRYSADTENITETKIVLGSRFLKSPPRNMYIALLNAWDGPFVAETMAVSFVLVSAEWNSAKRPSGIDRADAHRLHPDCQTADPAMLCKPASMAHLNRTLDEDCRGSAGNGYRQTILSLKHAREYFRLLHRVFCEYLGQIIVRLHPDT